MSAGRVAVRLPSTIKAAFEAYAHALGLHASELAKLLIARERKLSRLVILSESERAGYQNRPSGALPKITAYLPSEMQAKEFAAYAKRCGLSSNGAGAWLLERELREKWLEKALAAR